MRAKSVRICKMVVKWNKLAPKGPLITITITISLMISWGGEERRMPAFLNYFSDGRLHLISKDIKMQK